MIKIILYGILIYIVFSAFRFFQALNKKGKSTRSPKHQSEMMVKDEVCSTYLPKKDALRESIDGKEYFFCSKECRQKFLESKKPH